MARLSETAKGVESAFDFWLSQHDISVPEMFETAIKQAVTNWLDDNEDRIIEAIATAIATNAVTERKEE
jgi:hypothetical protein